MIRSPAPNPSGSLGRKRRAQRLDPMWPKAKQSSKVRGHGGQQPPSMGTWRLYHSMVQPHSLTYHVSPQTTTLCVTTPSTLSPLSTPLISTAILHPLRVLFAPKSASCVQKGWGNSSPMSPRLMSPLTTSVCPRYQFLQKPCTPLWWFLSPNQPDA